MKIIIVIIDWTLGLNHQVEVGLVYKNLVKF